MWVSMCQRAGNRIDHEGNGSSPPRCATPETQRAHTRCCSLGAPPRCMSYCGTGGPPMDTERDWNPFGLSWSGAREACERRGARLCTVSELSTLCCRAGCHEDYKYVWSSEACFTNGHAPRCCSVELDADKQPFCRSCAPAALSNQTETCLSERHAGVAEMPPLRLKVEAASSAASVEMMPLVFIPQCFRDGLWSAMRARLESIIVLRESRAQCHSYHMQRPRPRHMQRPHIVTCAHIALAEALRGTMPRHDHTCDGTPRDHARVPSLKHAQWHTIAAQVGAASGRALQHRGSQSALHVPGLGRAGRLARGAVRGNLRHRTPGFAHWRAMRAAGGSLAR